MNKRFQNKIAESRLTLPVISLYGTGVWLLCGIIQQQWWVQFACFGLAALLMVILNNQNALIRIYSRSVSAAFIIITCAACYLFPLAVGTIVQLSLVASLLTMYQTYQDKESVGLTFYTFLILSIGSVIEVRALWFVPVYWIIMSAFIYSLSIRTFLASILGIILPYWCISAWLLWMEKGDFSYFTSHFTPLTEFQLPYDYTSLAPTHVAVFAFLVILAATGIIHFFRTSFNDKIRTRQIFYSFMFINLVTTVFLIIQPQTEDIMLRGMIITTSPIIGHFVSLTNTRITNIAFCAILAVSLILTVINVWTSSFIF